MNQAVKSPHRFFRRRDESVNSLTEISIAVELTGKVNGKLNVN